MNLLRLLTVLGCTTLIGHAAPVSKLAAEWHVPSASSSKQFSLVDSASGTVRTAFMGSDGIVSWLHTVPTGVSSVSDVACGLIGAGTETIAITSPLANRVALVDVDKENPGVRLLESFSGTGPSALSELRTGGSTELIVGSVYNSGSDFSKAEVHDGFSTGGSQLASTLSAVIFRRAQPLQDPLNPGNYVAFYTATSSINTAAGLMLRSGASVVRYPKLLVAGNSEFIPGVTDINGAAGNPLILGFSAGSTSCRIIRVQTPIISASFTSTSVTLPFAVSGILPILDGGAGNITDGFIAIAADGSVARWIRINAAGNALVSTGQSFTPGVGSFLTGLIPLPGLGLMKLEGPSANSPSATFESLLWNGSSWVTADTGSLPALPGANTSIATLLYFDADPSTNDAARLLAVENAPDWTRLSFSPDPVPSSVIRENFSSSTGGLVFSSSHPVLPPHGTNFVMTNQVESALSIASVGSTAALFTENLTITPPSGTYDRSFQITALFDEGRNELYWRDHSGGSWTPWPGNLPVAYSRNLQFSLCSLTTGKLGGIVERNYQFDPASLASQDSDNDGVPDFVELKYGLDPFGGPDHDNDGVSDLDEILLGKDPDDSDSTPSTSLNLGSAGGFTLLTVARDYLNTEAADNEEILAHSLDGNLLDRAPVQSLPSVTRGATLKSDTAVPHNQLISLSSALYFDVNGGGRSGRELVRFTPADPPPSLNPVFTTTGTNLANDAAAWLAAANTALASRVYPVGRTVIDSADSAVSVLLEELTQQALVSARPVSDPAPALADFTLFPFRDGDRLKTPLTETDLSLLESQGFGFRLAHTLALTARGGMGTLASAIYLHHATTSASTPGLMMPIDALRATLRSGSLPAGYTGAATPATISTAKNAYDSVIGNAGNTFRPVETWTIEIADPPLERGIYLRQPGNSSVVLLQPDGDRFTLEQGLGLRPGSQFEVRGFTDTPLDHGYPTLEITSAVLVFEPTSSDNDSDGNLLDDEWERYFFGQIGQNPFSRPNGDGYSLLQYFLDGVDPRGTATPAGVPVSLSPQAPIIAPAEAGKYTVDFLFPEDYQDRFAFDLELSTTLQPGSFGRVPEATVSPVSGDEMRATVPASAASSTKAFYRVRVRLK